MSVLIPITNKEKSNQASKKQPEMTGVFGNLEGTQAHTCLCHPLKPRGYTTPSILLSC